MASAASSIGPPPPVAGASPHNDSDDGAVPKRPRLSASSTVTPIDSIAPDLRADAKGAISQLFGIDTPRDLQMEVIHHCAYNDNAVVYVNAKTAEGKSLCPLTVAAMRRGVAIILVPLIGLGSDQVAKASRADHNIEAYHIDEHKGPNAYALRERYRAYNKEESKHVIILSFINPQSLKRDPSKPNRGWFQTFSDLAEQDLISLICINEAHTVEQCGRSFRPEFLEAVTNLRLIREKMPNPAPFIAMSATFRQCDQDRITKLMKFKQPPAVVAGSLARRDIMWTTIKK